MEYTSGGEDLLLDGDDCDSGWAVADAGMGLVAHRSGVRRAEYGVAGSSGTAVEEIVDIDGGAGEEEIPDLDDEDDIPDLDDYDDVDNLVEDDPDAVPLSAKC